MDKELARRFLARYRRYVWVVVVASIVVNLLVFTGSVYMLLVYDSVLPSRSEPTLYGLFVMLVILYLLQGALETIRSEALLSLANGVHRDLLEPVHHAAVARSLQTQRENDGMQLTRDLDQVHTYLTSTGPVALIDLPWVVVFLAVLASLHWSLGLTALAGTGVLAAIAWWTSRRTTSGAKDVFELTGRRMSANQAEFRFAEAALAMGMQGRLRSRARELEEKYRENQSYLSRTVSRLGGAGRLFRLFLQSAMLTVGAVLVLEGHASGGIILAASILAGRALAPIDQAIANSRNMANARAGWKRIAEAMGQHAKPEARAISLAPPSHQMAVRDIWVTPPGSKTAVLQGVTFQLERGQAVAIIGPSAAGKSTLAKSLLGVWPVARGEIRIDGATHDQWDRDILGRSFGYVPQSIELLDGTIGENIARFDPQASSDAVIAAAKAAALHDIILAFPHGYDTRVGAGGGTELSAGQKQRIALARALYLDPLIVILDEPNSNLDAAGDAALSQAIMGVRERGGIVVMVTHRPATLSPITHVAVISGGKLMDFGERDEVLQRTTRGRAEAAEKVQAVPRLDSVRS